MSDTVTDLAPRDGGEDRYSHLLDVQRPGDGVPDQGRRACFRTVVGKVQAVSGVSLHLDPGETLGVVGESGCGKSTTGRAILQLHKPTVGSVTLRGRELTTSQRRTCAPSGGTCRSSSRTRTRR